MPTSDFRTIPAVLYRALEVKPKKILDVGIGCGKYGVLLREYLDGQHGRLAKHQWKVVIDGVEVFDAYQNPNWENYDYLYPADATKMKFPGKYDVVLLCDVLEHMSRAKAFALLRKCLENSKRVIVTTPYGFLEQGPVNKNVYEKHVSGFTPKDFKRFGAKDAAVFGNVFMVVLDA